MANVIVNDTNLTNIADAIREKNGLTDTYKPSEMAAAILAITTGGGGGADIEPIVLTGTQNYGCAMDLSGKMIELYGDKISTDNMTDSTYMFYKTPLESIPFTLNYQKNHPADINHMFSYAMKLKTLPAFGQVGKIRGAGYLFDSCQSLREIPDGYMEDWDWSPIDNATSAYGSYMDHMFGACVSLRKFPMSLLSHGNPQVYYSSSNYMGTFSGCYALDRVEGLPLPHTKATWTSNAFANTFDNCHRLEWFTFETQEDGTPYTANWKNQNINLSTYVGYAQTSSNIINFNSGCTAADEVTIDKYNQFYTNPNAWTRDVKCSAYNASRAANTIASLPDTSAYLATAGGTNTIKFKNLSGESSYRGESNTPYGYVGSQINETTLAAAIADAATKGWTVSLV